MKKRVVSIFLIVCMVFTMVPFGVLAAEDYSFRDVKKGDWYYDAVRYVCANGLFTGVSRDSFEPGGTMTRGMFVTVLGRMAGINAAKYMGTSHFTDVAEDAYYAPYVNWAWQYGITGGTGNNTFSPDRPIDRQQLACFFVRYFEAFGAEVLDAKAPASEEPEDLAKVAQWAKDAVLQLWQKGLLVGDGVNFDPAALATRAQAAELCTRLDHAVEVWFSEPGVPSGRVRVEPDDMDEEDDEEDEDRGGKGGSTLRTISFYDGDRLIDQLTAKGGQPLKELPAVEKSSKEGAVLLGYFYDEEFTKPFYAWDPIYESADVYAKYSEMPSTEELTVRTYTLQDQDENLEFVIRRSSNAAAGEPEAAKTAANLESKDGSDPVELAARDNGDGTYTVYAPDGYNKGCSYELTLDDGWIFDGKEASIRTASFTIYMEQVKNLRMGDDIIYIEDTDAISYLVNGKAYPVLTSDVMMLLDEGEAGSFRCPEEVQKGDVLCIYTGAHPEDRQMNGDLLDPAIYVTVSYVESGVVFFEALDEDAQREMYEVPDNFPILVPALPTAQSGTVNLSDLDVSMYETMVGKIDGTLEGAREKLSEGDFVTMYVSTLDTQLTGREEELFFGRVDSFSGDEITYTRVTREDIIDSMDLYAEIDLSAEDLLDEESAELLEAEVLSQVQESGFAEEAAVYLLDMAVQSEEFRADRNVYRLLGNPSVKALSSSFSMNDVDLDVQIGEGSRYGGVSVIIGVDAQFALEAEDGYVVIGLGADFEEEVMIAPGVKGDLVYKEILGIPVPVGVYVNASVDIKNYTAFSFDAVVTTKDEDGNVLGETSVTEDLDELMGVADYWGADDTYYDTLGKLVEQYSRMVSAETDWIKLVEEEIFTKEVFVYGLAIGVETDFVVRADISIAIGSGLSYEVGKRYSVWFKIGLFEPTAGSDTIDLLDEQFKFHFYVLGKLGVKAGVKAKIYAGLGSGKIASVGLAAEVGPYIKLWGLFIYDYERSRPAGASKWTTTSNMIGGLTLEFGMYLMLSFEAEALGLFEYSYDFLDEEYPLLESGDPKYYYRMNYVPGEDEMVYLLDEDRNRDTGISMILPDNLRALDFVNLKNGVIGTEALSYENYSVSLSNSDFTFDPETGRMSVEVEDGIHHKICDVTVTYLKGKLPFSDYDVSTTIRVIWTDLSHQELKEHYTVSVRVGNDMTGYDTVWNTRVLRGQEFDLPTDDQIRDLVGWSELEFDSAVGYTVDQTKGLTVAEDTLYSYVVNPRTYSITVDGIQNADGSIAEPRTYTAYYGEAFDFSDLEQTGTDNAERGIFTDFAKVTTDVMLPTAVQYGNNGAEMVDEPMNLYAPIGATVARALASGDVRANAQYMDASTTAVFTFNGLTHEDVTVKLRKGTVPSMEQVEEILEEEILTTGGQPLGISEVYPTLGPIRQSTNYIVTCTGLSGARANITFDVCGGYAMEPVDKLAGSLIVNIPEASRRGYTFRGWFTEPGGAGQDAFTQTVPEGGITIYAHWTPNTYCATFHMNGGDGNVPEPVLVTYDDLYENGNIYVAADTQSGYTKGDAYGKLPVPTYTGYKFLGWSTEPNRKADGALHVEDDTIANIYDSDHVLYAQWHKLEVVPKNVFSFGSRQYTTYDGGDHTASYTIDTKMQYNDEDYDGSNTKYFTEELLSNVVVEYKRQGIISEWEPAAVNAGIYDVKITRPSDGNFAYFTNVYYGVLEVKKAPSSMRETPTASCIQKMYYGNLLMDPSYITNYTGDGCVQFAATSSASQPSESAWSSGIVSNKYTSGSFYLWVRLSEGNNYLASEPVCSSSKISREGSAPKALIADDYDGQGFWYLLQVTTSSTSKSGTDSEVYATIGGEKFHMDSDANDHETGDSRKYPVTMGSSLPGSNSVDVTISLKKGGLAPGWKLGSLRLYVYKKTGNGIISDISKSPVLTSDVCSAEDWFLTDDYPRSSKTYTITGLGRSMSYSVSGPQGTVDATGSGWVEMSASMMGTDSNRGGLKYNVWQRRNAPVFTASFGLDKSFDRYLNWSREGDSWVCSFSKSTVCDAMREAGIYQLTLTYGIQGSSQRTMYVTIP